MTIYLNAWQPQAGQEIAAASAFVVSWQAYVDTPGAAFQNLAFRLMTDANGGGTDLINDGTNSGANGIGTNTADRTFTVPANTMTVGQTYWFRMMGFSGAEFVYVDRVVTATGTTVTPTISAPTAGAVISTATATVTWTLSTGAAQTHYQVQVLNGSTVVYDTGEVLSNTKTLSVPTPDTGVSRTIRVRAKRGTGYAWSSWATVSVTVTHTPPQTPTISSLTTADLAGVGVPHALVANVAQPATGAAPAVATTEFYVRKLGDASIGALVGAQAEAGGSSLFVFAAPTAGVTYEMRARNVASDGRSAYSAWVAANGPITLRGVLLSVASGVTPVNLLANGSFEVDTSTWVVSGGTFTRVADSGGGVGDYVGGFVSSGPGTQVVSSPTVSIAPGQLAVLSVSLKMQVTSIDYYIQTDFYGPAGGSVVATSRVLFPASGLSGVAFTRMTVGVEAPENVDRVRIRVLPVTGTLPSGSGFRIDGATIQALPMTRLFRYNGDEVEDDYQPEAQLIQYDGRALPTVEFGTSATRELGVKIDVKTDADRDALRTILLSRQIALYRDRRGRKVYAYIKGGALVDTIFGYSTSLLVQAVDYPFDRSV